MLSLDAVVSLYAGVGIMREGETTIEIAYKSIIAATYRNKSVHRLANFPKYSIEY